MGPQYLGFSTFVGHTRPSQVYKEHRGWDWLHYTSYGRTAIHFVFLWLLYITTLNWGPHKQTVPQLHYTTGQFWAELFLFWIQESNWSEIHPQMGMCFDNTMVDQSYSPKWGLGFDNTMVDRRYSPKWGLCFYNTMVDQRCSPKWGLCFGNTLADRRYSSKWGLCFENTLADRRYSPKWGLCFENTPAVAAYRTHEAVSYFLLTSFFLSLFPLSSISKSFSLFLLRILFRFYALFVSLILTCNSFFCLTPFCIFTLSLCVTLSLFLLLLSLWVSL